MYGHCNLSFTLPSSLRWINRFAQTPIYVFPSFLKICCAPLVEDPLGTNTSSDSFMVSLAILQVHVLALVSLEIAKPRILDSVVSVISRSLIHTFHVLMFKVCDQYIRFIVHQPVYFLYLLEFYPYLE